MVLFNSASVQAKDATHYKEPQQPEECRGIAKCTIIQPGSFSWRKQKWPVTQKTWSRVNNRLAPGQRKADI